MCKSLPSTCLEIFFILYNVKKKDVGCDKGTSINWWAQSNMCVVSGTV